MGALATASDRMHLWSPVLVKEMRTRMRGARLAWLQAGYVFAMLIVMGAVYAEEVGSAARAGSTAGFQIGRALYLGLFIVQAALVALIVPGLTAGAVSGEQEQKTYELLACTRMRARQVVVGKLLSAWLFAALLLTTSLPLAALCLLFGGVSPAELMWSYSIIALCALLLAAIGLWWSAAVSRSLLAVMGAYATMGAFMIVTGWLVAVPWGYGHGYMPGASVFASLNPFAAIFFAANPIPVYGWSIPSGIASVLLLLLGALLLTAAASQRLPLFGRRSGIFVRLLMIALFAAVMSLSLGNFGQLIRTGPTLGAARTGVAVTFCAIIGLLMALSPIVAAGELNEPLRGRFLPWLLGGLSPRRLLQPRVRSALPFLVVLTAVGVAVLIGSMLYFAPRMSAVWWQVIYRLGVLTVAAAFGCTMLGLWAALAMPGTRGRVVYGVGLVIAYILTFIIVATAPAGPRLLSMELTYLNPALIALSYARPAVYSSLAKLTGAGAGLGVAATSAALYVIIGVVALAGAASAFRRQATPVEAGDE